MYIVSSCLTGVNCKYSGGNNDSEQVRTFIANREYVLVCPEVLGGLPTPRVPAERRGDSIVDRDGADVTEEFVRGAKRALQEAIAAAERSGSAIEGAVLRRRSPSCGCGEIYDGTFSGNVISGDGIFAELLKSYGISVITEDDL